MFIKSMGAVIIIVSSSLIGYIIRYRHRCRINDIENFNTCLGIIKREMSFSLNDILTAVKKTAGYANKQNKLLFEGFIDMSSASDGDTMSETWTRCLETRKGELIYNESDIDVIKELGNLLGSGDIDTQRENILNIENKLNEHLKQCSMNSEKYDIAFKLGIYIGVIIVVLLI